VNGEIVAARDVADPAALKIAYQSGRVDTGRRKSEQRADSRYARIFDMAGNLHDRFRSMVTRARLKAANGTADNQVTLMFPPTGTPVRSGELLASHERVVGQHRQRYIECQRGVEDRAR